MVIFRAVAFLAVLASGSVAFADAFKPDGGPYVIAIADIALRDDARAKDLPARISYPEQDGSYPLVILSHGGGSSKDGYTRVADHWASHGYVVIAPTHEDSASLGFDVRSAGGPRMVQITQSRMDDFAFLIAYLDHVVTAVPGLVGKIDRNHMAAAGHSMGGGTALAATGLKLKHKKSGAISAMGNPGFSALVLLSEPGRNPMMPDEPWRQVDVPTLIYTGTNDFGGMSDGSKSPFGNDAVPNPDAQAPKYYLWIDGVDHYMGGLWCCEGSNGPPDNEALALFKGVSTAFLDATMKGDAVAHAFLNSARVSELSHARASLTLK